MRSPRTLVAEGLAFLDRHRRRVLVLVVALVLLGTALASLAYLTTPFTPSTQRPVSALAGSNASQLDSDHDGLPDIQENYVWGTDPYTADSNHDGIPDGWEAAWSTVNTTTGLRCPDPLVYDAATDCTGNGLTNLATWNASVNLTRAALGRHDVSVTEVVAHGLDPAVSSTLGDGIPDGWAVRHGLNPLDPNLPGQDPDHDGLTNLQEARAGTDPHAVDSDHDGISDPAELAGHATILGKSFTFHPTDPARASTGGSGIPDGWLLYYGQNLTDPNVAYADASGNGLTDRATYLWSLQHTRDVLGRVNVTVAEVIQHGLDPNAFSTLGDGIADGWAIQHGLDPLDPAMPNQDPDHDGLTNRQEFVHHTDPHAADTDGDGLADGVEVAGWNITVNGKEVTVHSDPTRVDTNGNGLSDKAEHDGHGILDGVPYTFPPLNPSVRDTDSDGLDDVQEITFPLPNGFHLDPTKTDSSGDGIPDGREVALWHAWSASIQAQAASDPSALAWMQTAWNGCHGGTPASGLAKLLQPGADLDCNGIPNVLDPDADADGLTNGQEVNGQTVNGTAIPPTKAYNPDTDGDGLTDGWEVHHEQVDPGCHCLLLDPTRKDSNGDGTPDGLENYDHDGLACGWVNYPFTNLLEQQAGTDPFNPDTDHDGLNDGWEYYFSHVNQPALPLDPLTPDHPPPYEDLPYVDFRTVPASQASSDAAAAALVPLDNASDETVHTVWSPSEQPGGDYYVAEVYGTFHLTYQLAQANCLDPTAANHDTNGDGIPDAWALLRHLPTDQNVASGDPDHDGLTNLQEYQYNPTAADPHLRSTNPLLADTDHGGTSDGNETRMAAQAKSQGVTLSALNPADDAPNLDLDGDGLTTRQELCVGQPSGCVKTNPLNPDTDHDGLLDGANVDLDLTRSADLAQAKTFLQDGIVWEAIGSHTLRFLGETSVGTNPTNWSSARDGLPDGWKAYYGTVLGGTIDPATFARDQSYDGDGLSNLQEYQLGMPSTWNVTLDGPWWLGSDPTTAHTTGTNQTDGGPTTVFSNPNLNHDYDGDGLNDFTGADPNPLSDPGNTGTPLAGNMLRVWQWLGHPNLDVLASYMQLPDQVSRVDASHRDTTGQGIPDRLDRARVNVTITGVSPSTRVYVGTPFHVHGTVTVDEPTSDEGRGVPGVVVHANLGAATADPTRLACAGVTDAQGTFDLTCTMAPSPSLQLPSDAVLLQQRGGTVTWPYRPLVDPTTDLGPAVLTVWTTGTLRGTADPPIHIAGGHTATAVRAGLAHGPTLQVSSPTSIRTPTTLRVPNGGNLSFQGTLVDGAGEPLANRTLQVTWNGSTTDVPVGPAGTFKTDLDAPRLDAPGERDLTASLPDQGYLLGNSTTVHVLLRFPSNLHVTPPTDPTSGQPTTVAGTLQGPNGTPVAGASVRATLAGASGNATTGPDGAFTLQVVVPAGADPGATTLTVSTAGTDRYGPATADAVVNLRRPVTVVVDPPVDGSYYVPYQLTGRVVDSQGVPVRSVAGEPVQVSLTWPPYYAASTAVGGAGNAPGAFAFDVPGPALHVPGTSRVTVSFPGTPFYAPGSTQVLVPVHLPTRIELPGTNVVAGAPFQVQGRVLGADGEPAANLSLTVTVAGLPSANTTTGPDGSFALPFALPADTGLGPLQVAARTPGAFPHDAANVTTVYTVVSATRLTLAGGNVTSSTAWINGTLQDARGNPLPGQPVALTWRGETLGTVLTDPHGGFARPLTLAPDVTPGPAPVTATFPGATGRFMGSTATANLTVVARGQLTITQLSPFVIDRPFHLEGHLQTAGGADLSDTRVNVLVDGRPVGTAPVQGGTFRFSSTLQNVPAGNGTLAVVFPGTTYLRGATVRVPVDVRQPATLEIVHLPASVPRDGTGTGEARLTTADGAPIGNATLLVQGAPGAVPFTVTTDASGRASFPVLPGRGTATQVTVSYAGGGAYASTQSSAVVSTAPTVLQQGIEGTGVILALLGLAGLAALYLAKRRSQAMAHETAEVLETLRRDLWAGNEFEASIRLAYERLVALGEHHGIVEEAHLSVREFGARLAEHLPLAAGSLDGLVTLIEEVRYGARTAGPADRDRADVLLRRILRDLRDAEAASPGGDAPAAA